MNLSRFSKRMLRYYLYIRRGITHVGIAISFINFINIFYLISREWIFFQNLRYLYIVFLVLAILSPILVLVGYLDYKRGFFALESALNTEQNPYCEENFMGKEKKYLLPITIMSTKLNLKVNELVLASLEIRNRDVNLLMEKLQEHLNLLEAKLREDEK